MATLEHYFSKAGAVQAQSSSVARRTGLAMQKRKVGRPRKNPTTSTQRVNLTTGSTGTSREKSDIHESGKS